MLFVKWINYSKEDDHTRNGNGNWRLINQWHDNAQLLDGLHPEPESHTVIISLLFKSTNTEYTAKLCDCSVYTTNRHRLKFCTDRWWRTGNVRNHGRRAPNEAFREDCEFNYYKVKMLYYICKPVVTLLPKMARFLLSGSFQWRFWLI